MDLDGARVVSHIRLLRNHCVEVVVSWDGVLVLSAEPNIRIPLGPAIGRQPACIHIYLYLHLVGRKISCIFCTCEPEMAI